MTNITGVTAFETKGSTGAVTLNNIADATMSLGFEGTNTGGIVANYKAGALSGTSDNATVVLETASKVALDVDSGFESMSIAVNGTSDIDTLTIPGISTVTVTGSGNLDFANATLDGVGTLSASTYTGVMTTGTVSTTTGYVDADIVGATTGSSILLGSGNDSIGFTGATSASTSTNAVKLGAGNDQLVLNVAGSGGSFVFGEAGDDKIQVNTTALGTEDLIDGGEGTDELKLNVASNTMVLKGIENLTLTSSATGTQTINSADSALAVTANVAGTAVDLNDLTASSTVKVQTESGAGTTTATGVAVEFLSQEASTTLDIASGMTGVLETEKVSNVTVNLGAASDIASAYSFINATDVTINATGALSTTTGQNIVDGTAADSLKNVTVTGTDLVKVGTVTSTVLETVNVTAAKDLTYGAIGGDSTKLTTVSLTATAGAIAGNAAIGKTDNTNTLSVTATATGNVDLAAIESTKIGNISVSTSGLAKTVDVGAIGSTATTIGNITLASKGDLTAGLTGNTTEVATSVGTITMSSESGKVDFDNINTKDSGGLDVSFTAKTTIDSDGANTAAVVENVGGNISATLAGAALATVNFLATTSGVVNLTASNTGGLTSTITNASTAGAGETSTITLGNAASTKTNALTVAGDVDTLNITGGSGTDTLAFTQANNDIAKGTINMGGGTDTIDFSGLQHATTASITNGIVANFSSSTITFDAGQSYASSIASGKVAEYDPTTTNADVVTTNLDLTVSGVETVVGTAEEDYIAVSNTGMTVTGGAKVDSIVLAAGDDDVVITTGSANYDQIANFTVGTTTTGDQIKALDATFSWAFGTSDGTVALGTGTNMDGAATNNANATVMTISTNAAANTFDNFIAGTDNEATMEGNIATALGTATDGTFVNTAKILVAVDDGEHTGLFYVQSAADGNAIAAAEMELVGILTGVADATTLLADDFLFA